MRRIWTLIFLFTMSFSQAETGENEHRKFEYAELNQMLNFAENKARSPFFKTQIKIDLLDNTKKLTDVRLWLSKDKQIIKKIPIKPDHSLDLPIYNEVDAETIWVNINQPKGVVRLELTSNVTIGSKTEVAYYDLFIALEDINDLMGEMAGMASWFMPNMDAIKFVFDKPASIEIYSKKKTYRYKTNEDHKISIDARSKLMKENPKVVFSISPIRIEPED